MCERLRVISYFIFEFVDCNRSHVRTIASHVFCKINSLSAIVRTLSYFEIVFSVLIGFSVNFTLRKKAVGIYLGIYEDMH